jgi:hypothetical protein
MTNYQSLVAAIAVLLVLSFGVVSASSQPGKTAAVTFKVAQTCAFALLNFNIA